MSAAIPAAPPENAYDLPIGHFRNWLTRAGEVWKSNYAFFLLMSLLVVLVRRWLDAMTLDLLILVSYFSDAFIFAWLFMGLQDRKDERSWSIVRCGWLALKGRFFRVFKTAVWGIPAAITSFVIFLVAPEVVLLLAVLQDNAVAASILLFLALLIGGLCSLMLSMLPVLAAIQMARDPHATLQSCSLWAYRGVRAGIGPLSALFVTFLLGTLICSVITTSLMGHMPIETFSEWKSEQILEALSDSPITLFIAMNVFLALLQPVASDLLRSADIDLSDEIFSDTDKVVQGDAFWVLLLDNAGRALRILAAVSVLFLSVYAAVSGMDEALGWFFCAILAYVFGGSFRKSALAWREGGSWSLRYRFILTPLLLLVLFVVGYVADW